jgi:hypothetical protein
MQQLWDILNAPRKLAGVCGLIFVVLFVLAGPILQGDTPKAGDTAAEIRAYWESDGDRYLVGDYIFGIAVVLFFMGFVIALRSVLEPADRSGGLWARAMLAGALIGVVLGGAGAQPSGALGFAGPEGMDDSTLLFATRVSAYSVAGLGLGFALMLFGAAVVIGQSGVLWRWLAVLAALAAVVNVLGGLWVPQGDQEGAFGVLGFIGLLATIGWVLAVSVQLLLPGRQPAPVQQLQLS